MDVCTPLHWAAAGVVCRSTLCRAEEPPSSTLSEPSSLGHSLYLGTHIYTRDEWVEDRYGMYSYVWCVFMCQNVGNES